MSRDLKIWIVAVLVYIGLILGTMSFTGFFEVPSYKISAVPYNSNSVTASDYFIVEYGFLDLEEFLGV